MRRSSVALALVAALCLGVGGLIGHMATKSGSGGGASAPAAFAAPQRASVLEQFEEAFSRVAEKVGPAVVNISAKKVVVRRYREPFEEFFRRFFEEEPWLREFFPPEERVFRQELRSLGSGVIVEYRGKNYVITAAHVVEIAADNPSNITVTLEDGRRLEVKEVRMDKEHDVAVLVVEAGGRLPSAVLGDSSKVKPGQWAIAFGNPFGLTHTMTVGIVSAVGRVLAEGGGARTYIQTDAAINPGNSGGPLVNIEGEVIGINRMIYSVAPFNIGIGFAIPINVAKRSMVQLIERGKVARGWLGVAVEDLTPDWREVLGAKDLKGGAVVQSVVPGSPAEKAGIRMEDVIIAFGDQEVRSAGELVDLVGTTEPGTVVPVKVWRKGEVLTVKVKIGERTPEVEASLLGKGEFFERRLGITVRNVTKEEMGDYGLEAPMGVVVTKVEPGSPAAMFGIREGDLIVQVNRRTVRNVADFRKEMEAAENRVHLVVYRVGPGMVMRQAMVIPLKPAGGR